MGQLRTRQTDRERKGVEGKGRKEEEEAKEEED